MSSEKTLRNDLIRFAFDHPNQREPILFLLDQYDGEKLAARMLTELHIPRTASIPSPQKAKAVWSALARDLPPEIKQATQRGWAMIRNSHDLRNVDSIFEKVLSTFLLQSGVPRLIVIGVLNLGRRIANSVSAAFNFLAKGFHTIKETISNLLKKFGWGGKTAFLDDLMGVILLLAGALVVMVFAVGISAAVTKFGLIPGTIAFIAAIAPAGIGTMLMIHHEDKTASSTFQFPITKDMVKTDIARYWSPRQQVLDPSMMGNSSARDILSQTIRSFRFKASSQFNHSPWIKREAQEIKELVLEVTGLPNIAHNVSITIHNSSSGLNQWWNVFQHKVERIRKYIALFENKHELEKAGLSLEEGKKVADRIRATVSDITDTEKRLEKEISDRVNKLGKSYEEQGLSGIPPTEWR